jgi:hypothetical protein
MSCTPDHQISNQLRPVALEIRFTQMNFPIVARMDPFVAHRIISLRFRTGA